MIENAGIISVFRTLFLILLVYYGFKLIVRYLIPFLFRLFLKNHAGKQYRQKQEHKKEGEISIDTPPKSSAENDNLGEYVDFEEIKENHQK